jgi:hypothetical protein
MVVSDAQAEGRACIVCHAPGERGMGVNIFRAGEMQMWACSGACSDTMFEVLGLADGESAR